MIFVVSALTAIVCYLLGSWIQRQRMDGATPQDTPRPALIGVVGWLAHAVTVFMHVITEQGLLLDLGSALSLTAWTVTGVVLYSSLRKPTANLLIIIMPLTALCLAFAIFTPPTTTPMAFATELLVHILSSFIAYALFAVAALQAVILAYQNTHLKSHLQTRIMRSFPPLQTMESLLFDMLLAGVVMLTLSLATGLFYLEDMFAQHLVHKTVLSICAWFIFATLLVGHYRMGWRGRTAIRWTLAGFALLLIAYFGSKLVIEYLL